MQIRDMSIEDIDGIMTIEYESFRYPWTKAAIEAEYYNDIATYLVVYNDDKLCGYGGYLAVLNEAYITNIAVATDERKKGYGTALLNALLERAEKDGITAVTLEVRVSNEGAIRLYERLGFVSSGIRPKFYPDGEDAKIFWLKLGGN